MDIWLLFGLLLPFVGFLLSLYEEILVQDEEDDDEKQVQVK